MTVYYNNYYYCVCKFIFLVGPQQWFFRMPIANVISSKYHIDTWRCSLDTISILSIKSLNSRLKCHGKDTILHTLSRLTTQRTWIIPSQNDSRAICANHGVPTRTKTAFPSWRIKAYNAFAINPFLRHVWWVVHQRDDVLDL